MVYRILYSTVIDNEVIDAAAKLPFENIYQIDKHEFLGLINSGLINSDTIQSNEVKGKLNTDIIDVTANKNSIINDINIENENTISQTNIATAKPAKSIEIKDSPDAQANEVHHDEQGKSMETIRIRLDVLDKLMNLAGELVLVRNQQLMNVNRTDPISRTISQRLDIVTSDLQETIMRTRMQPIGTVFGKFSRIVRDLGKKLDKLIEIEMIGNDVELDKTILETLTDPLTHLIRNCCDHAIESAPDRQKAGKNPTGKIRLLAYHEGGQMNIEISDDGKGIDIDAVKAKAIEKGLKTEDELTKMSEKEILSLIFLPGFSTVSSVSSLSGRGVGMDVVRISIEKLGGLIEIQTKKGAGTQILLRLPLTLAIIPSLIVISGGFRYAIPQVNLEELVCLYDDQVNSKIEYAGTKEVYRLRDFLLPIVHLSEILKRPKPFTETEKSEIAEYYRTKRLRQSDKNSIDNLSITFAVLKAGNSRFGLVIDSVIGTEEIVVKPMHRVLSGLSIYSGATVLGDGRVALILDTNGIVAHVGIEPEEKEADDLKDSNESFNAHDEFSYDILLFKSSKHEQFAINLSEITRIERIMMDKIEYVGDKEYINIQGISLPVVRLESFLNITRSEDEQEMYLLLPKNPRYPCGILARNLIDIGSYKLVIDNNACSQKGIVGSAIIDNKMTLILDTDILLSLALPEIDNKMIINN